MVKAYNSAFPRWTTYTPNPGQVGVQPPVNQENYWRNRARQWQPTSIHGWLNRTAMEVAGTVKGTGAGYAAATGPMNRPIMNQLGGLVGQRTSNRRQWAQQMQQAANQPRTAPPQVNPVAVQQQQAAQQVAANAAQAAVASPNIGRAHAPVPPGGVVQTPSGLHVVQGAGAVQNALKNNP